MNIDTDLVKQAAQVLGTHGTTATVHAAMEEVVRGEKRRRLADWELPDLTLETLAEMRKGEHVED